MWMAGLVGLVSWNTLEVRGMLGQGLVRDFWCAYDDLEVTKRSNKFEEQSSS